VMPNQVKIGFERKDAVVPVMAKTTNITRPKPTRMIISLLTGINYSIIVLLSNLIKITNVRVAKCLPGQ